MDVDFFPRFTARFEIPAVRNSQTYSFTLEADHPISIHGASQVIMRRLVG
jgi:hypothetical protein